MAGLIRTAHVDLEERNTVDPNYSAKSRLKMQREVLKSTVERMTQQKDEYKTRTEDLYRFDYACVTPFFMDCDAGIEWVVLFIIYCNLCSCISV